MAGGPYHEAVRACLGCRVQPREQRCIASKEAKPAKPQPLRDLPSVKRRPRSPTEMGGQILLHWQVVEQPSEVFSRKEDLGAEVTLHHCGGPWLLIRQSTAEGQDVWGKAALLQQAVLAMHGESGGWYQQVVERRPICFRSGVWAQEPLFGVPSCGHSTLGYVEISFGLLRVLLRDLLAARSCPKNLRTTSE